MATTIIISTKVNPDLRTALIFIYSLPFSRGVNMTEGGLLSLLLHIVHKLPSTDRTSPLSSRGAMQLIARPRSPSPPIRAPNHLQATG